MPEPKTVKNRVHLDIYARSIDDLVALGATVPLPAEESGFAWTVMLDPEGNEFCAFLRDEPPAYRLHGIGIDCVDPEAQARWWAEVFGAELSDNAQHGGGWWTAAARHRRPGAHAATSCRCRSRRRSRTASTGTSAARSRSSSTAGATRLWDTRGWVVMADPEGNEFCVFPRA